MKADQNLVNRSERLIAIAEIAKPHGITGELRLKLYNEHSDLLVRGLSVIVTPKDQPTSSGQRMRIDAIRQVPGAPLVRLSEISGRDRAEAMRGASLSVPRSSFPVLEEGEFYACDVEGAAALDADGNSLGTVIELMDYPTCQVLLLDRGDGKRIEVPVNEHYVGRVDIEQPAVHFLSIEDLE